MTTSLSQPVSMPGQQHDLVCPECGARMVLKRSEYGVFYGCDAWTVTKCSGSHSAHQQTGAPMGVPATAQVKRARREAHDAFDTLWSGDTPAMKRSEAYRWMRTAMGGLSKQQAHIGMFDEKQCAQLVTLVHNRRHFTVETDDG